MKVEFAIGEVDKPETKDLYMCRITFPIHTCEPGSLRETIEEKRYSCVIQLREPLKRSKDVELVQHEAKSFSDLKEAVSIKARDGSGKAMEEVDQEEVFLFMYMCLKEMIFELRENPPSKKLPSGVEHEFRLAVLMDPANKDALIERSFMVADAQIPPVFRTI